MTVRALVLAGYGLNCDYETAHSLELAGARARRVHISELTGTAHQGPTVSLDDYHILVFGGGFAWADDHGAGVILATRLGNHIGDQLRQFLARGGLVMGICNGFQALVNLGLLPRLQDAWERSVALIANDCGNFQNRWVEMTVEEQSPCIFTKGISSGLMAPIRHGEGKFVASEDTLASIESLNLVALRYARGKKPAGGKFPANPNGSLNDIAGICDLSGRVFGLMPHPEGYYRMSQHPAWTALREKERRKGRGLDPQAPGAGLALFENAVRAAGESV